MSKSNTGNRVLLSRREALKLSASAGVAAVATPVYASDSIKTGVHQQQPPFCSTPPSAVAHTKYGNVRGFVSGDVFTFKGVPYGQDTGGKNRWLPAKPPIPWEGEYPALIYGANCPQHLHDWHSQEQVFLQDWDDGWQSEDMLKLNIWTPSLTGSRPVMFYIHGGGFEFGSSYELPSHEGANMARYHDVVQVSVNHRLNALGFLDVSEVGGAGYEDSSNVGMTDLVAALKWVQENIANFGGDPNRVMIYGQSGGGGKVATLMGMPSAQGLFHCAAIQSGGSFFGSADEAKQLTRQMVKDLGLAPNDIEALQKMDWKDLMAAADAAQGKLPANPHMPFRMHGPPRRFWMPILDGHVIPTRSFQDAAPEISKNIPLMVGSVSEEGNSMASRPTEAEWRANLSQGLWRGKGQGSGRRHAEGLSTEKRAHPLIHVRRRGLPERALHAQRCSPYGETEARFAREPLSTPTTSPGKPRCWTGFQGPGTPPTYSSASTTPFAVNKVRETRPKRRCWRKRWPLHGRTLHARAIPVSRVFLGNPPTRLPTRLWSGITSRAWSTIQTANCARSSFDEGHPQFEKT